MKRKISGGWVSLQGKPKLLVNIKSRGMQASSLTMQQLCIIKYFDMIKLSVLHYLYLNYYFYINYLLKQPLRLLSNKMLYYTVTAAFCRHTWSASKLASLGLRSCQDTAVHSSVQINHPCYPLPSFSSRFCVPTEQCTVAARLLLVPKLV